MMVKYVKLKRSLYGLKQSPRAWFRRFTSGMKLVGNTQSNSDHTLFVKHEGEKIAALIMYVGDIVFTGNDVEEVEKLQWYLATLFEMKDLGYLQYFLSIEISRSNLGVL